ncbi:MAG: HAMP domain-containing sensor histidine kinase [Bacteroidota bacterium]
MTKNVEQDRLKKLLEYQILDTPEEADFDELVKLASSICNTPISLVSLIDDKRQWFKAHIGLSVRETAREISFCQNAILTNELYIIEDAVHDKRYASNPLVTGDPNIGFYAGMPLTTEDGYNLGTICVIDREPRILNHHQQEALKIIAKQVIKLLELKLSVLREKETSKQLENTTVELKEANKVKDKIFSIVAHDLRSPLRNINSILEMYKDGDISEDEAAEFIKSLSHKVRETADMIDNLLSWAKTQINNTEAFFQEVNLLELVENKVGLFKSVAEDKGISFEVDIAQSINVKADIEMLKIVFRNLINNAIKFSNPNGKITLKAVVEGNEAIVCVADNGTGIAAGDIEKLFSATTHLSTYGTKNEKGTGIGLQLCKDLLAKNNGNIWVESELGKGSCFYFSIPC